MSIGRIDAPGDGVDSRLGDFTVLSDERGQHVEGGNARVAPDVDHGIESRGEVFRRGMARQRQHEAGELMLRHEFAHAAHGLLIDREIRCFDQFQLPLAVFVTVFGTGERLRQLVRTESIELRDESRPDARGCVLDPIESGLRLLRL